MIKISSRKVIYTLCNYLLLITPDSIILLITITFLKKNYLLHSITVINDFIAYYFDYILLITPSLAKSVCSVQLKCYMSECHQDLV